MYYVGFKFREKKKTRPIQSRSKSTIICDFYGRNIKYKYKPISSRLNTLTCKNTKQTVEIRREQSTTQLLKLYCISCTSKIFLYFCLMESLQWLESRHWKLKTN